MVLSIALPLVAQLYDKRRMTPEMRARTWNYSTWGAALYAFGPISMLGWMWVTRPRWWRVLLGALATAAMFLPLEIAAELFEAVVGPAPDLADAALQLFELELAAFGGSALLLALFELVVSLRGRRRVV